MAQDRIPANSKYCKEVNCHWQSGNKCTQESCIRKGNEKRQITFTRTGHLAEGDVPE